MENVDDGWVISYRSTGPARGAGGRMGVCSVPPQPKPKCVRAGSQEIDGRKKGKLSTHLQSVSRIHPAALVQSGGNSRQKEWDSPLELAKLGKGKGLAEEGNARGRDRTSRHITECSCIVSKCLRPKREASTLQQQRKRKGEKAYAHVQRAAGRKRREGRGSKGCRGVCRSSLGGKKREARDGRHAGGNRGAVQRDQ
jgi:hypothetical protein